MKRYGRIVLPLLFLLLLGAAGGIYYVLLLPHAALQPSLRQEKKTAEEHPLEGNRQTDWNTYHGDNTLRGMIAEGFPETLALLWRFKAGAPVRQTPVICNRRIFFATARGDVIATDLNGQRVWARELFTGEKQNDVPVRERIEAPMACFDGLVLAGSMRGVLYAFEAATGKDKWQTQIEGPVYGSPNYLRGRVYVLSRASGELHCLDAASGKILWKSEAIERCDGSPAVSADAVVFGSCASALHVFSPDTGKLLRTIEVGQDSQVAGGVALDGNRIISGSRSGKVLQAGLQTGHILWANTDGDTEAFSTPAITKEIAVVSYNDGNVRALDRETGKLRWRYDTKGYPTSPVIVGDKVVVGADGELLLLKLTDGTKLGSVKVSDEITAPAVTQGLILVGSEDGTVAAFGPAPEQEGAAHP